MKQQRKYLNGSKATTPGIMYYESRLGDIVTPSSTSSYKVTLAIRHRFQFSSALKRMSTISSLPGGRLVAAVKGAPETIKKMLKTVPQDYNDTYKWYMRQGSCVLALGMKEMEPLSSDKVGLQSDRLLPFFFCLFIP